MILSYLFTNLFSIETGIALIGVSHGYPTLPLPLVLRICRFCAILNN